MRLFLLLFVLVRVLLSWGDRLTRYPNETHYSPNFSKAELNCSCFRCRGKEPGRKIRRRLRVLAVQLERFRRELGAKRVGILSGYRCPAHNKDVHGASQSKHMQGRAADIAVPRGQQKKYVAAAERVPRFRRGGIGVYPNGGLHVDTRVGWARWSWYRRS